MKRTFFVICMLAMAVLTAVGQVKVTIVNPSVLQRHEVVELSADSIARQMGLPLTSGDFVVYDALNVEIPWQLTSDGKLLIFSSVRPQGKATYTIKSGKPQPMKACVFVRQYPWRLDDLVIENDRSAYRFYGPSLQKKGERGFGIDVWLKNSPEMVVDSLYRMQQRGISFHINHGLGMDCYNVGPSLGCGAPALVEADTLIFPWCYKNYRVLENGPLRIEVQLDFAPVVKGSYGKVTEHRIIQMDRGSVFTRMTVWYEGLQRPATMAAGVVIHEAQRTGSVLRRNYLHYADPTGDPGKQNCQIYVASLFPEGVGKTKRMMYKHPENGIAGHAVGFRKGLQEGERFTYWFGSAWSEYEVHSQNQWELIINQFMKEKRNPCIVQYGE